MKQEVCELSHIKSNKLPVFNSSVMCVPPQELILESLKAETFYSISVAAYTTKGDGAHSKAKLVQTLGIGKHMPSIQFSAID